MGERPSWRPSPIPESGGPLPDPDPGTVEQGVGGSGLAQGPRGSPLLVHFFSEAECEAGAGPEAGQGPHSAAIFPPPAKPRRFCSRFPCVPPRGRSIREAGGPHLSMGGRGDERGSQPVVTSGSCAPSRAPFPEGAGNTSFWPSPRSGRPPQVKGEKGPEVSRIPALLPQECTPSSGGAWAPADPGSQKGKSAALSGQRGTGKVASPGWSSASALRPSAGSACWEGARTFSWKLPGDGGPFRGNFQRSQTSRVCESACPLPAPGRAQ